MLACGGSPATPPRAPAPATTPAACEHARSDVVLAPLPASVPAALAPTRAALEAGQPLDAASLGIEVLEDPSAPADVRASAGWLVAHALFAAGLHQSALAVVDQLTNTGPARGPLPAELQPLVLALSREPHTRDTAQRMLDGSRAAGATPTGPAYALPLARGALEAGDPAIAEAVLASVPRAAPEWLDAQWTRAEAALYLTQFDRAAAAFASLAETDPCARRRDLARLSLARLYFGAGTGGGDGRGESMLNAYTLFDAVDPYGPYASDAALGRAWAAMWLDAFDESREALDRIDHAFRQRTVEVDVLEAMLALQRCDAATGRAALARVSARAALLAELRASLPDDDEALAQRATEWVRGDATLGGALETLRQSLRADDVVRDAIEARAALAREQEVLAAAPAAFRASPAGQRAEQDLFVAASFGTSQLAERVRSRANGIVDDAGAQAARLDELGPALDACSAEATTN